MKKFITAFEEGKVSLMYELIGECPSLMELHEAQALEDDWNYHLVLAEKYAAKGDMVNVVSSLEDFFQIKAKFFNIALVAQQAYISQLNRALRLDKSASLIENAIKQYLLFFAEDEYLDDFVERFLEKHSSVLDLSRLKKGDIDLFRPNMIIPEIVVK